MTWLMGILKIFLGEAFDKALLDKSFNIAKKPKYDA